MQQSIAVVMSQEEMRIIIPVTMQRICVLLTEDEPNLQEIERVSMRLTVLLGAWIRTARGGVQPSETTLQ